MAGACDLKRTFCSSTRLTRQSGIVCTQHPSASKGAGRWHGKGFGHGTGSNWGSRFGFQMVGEDVLFTFLQFFGVFLCQSSTKRKLASPQNPRWRPTGSNEVARLARALKKFLTSVLMCPVVSLTLNWYWHDPCCQSRQSSQMQPIGTSWKREN